MKRLFIISLVLGVLVAGWVAFPLLKRAYYPVMSLHTYSTIEEAMKEGVATSGWLPEGLPRSARNLRIQIDHAENTAIVAFSFDPGESLTDLLQHAEEVSPAGVGTILPPAMKNDASWFPGEIMKGRFEEMARAGFKFHMLTKVSTVGQDRVSYTWYVAVPPKGENCYVWFVVLPERSERRRDDSQQTATLRRKAVMEREIQPIERAVEGGT